jgi:uncharacterized SAM-binding protein YcdF (DUF218 family)
MSSEKRLGRLGPSAEAMTLARTKAVLIGAMGLSLALLLSGFFVFAAIANRAALRSLGPTDGIVVLTGGEARIAEGARLLTLGHGRRLLISGVNRRTTRDELRRLTGLSQQMFDCCVDIGYEALDTYGNADEARAWTRQWNFSSLMIVTASYHMLRSMAELGIAMPDVTLVPQAVTPRHLQGSTPWWLQLRATRTIVAEYLKFIPVAGRLMAARLIGMREGHSAALVSNLRFDRQ